MGKDKIGSSQNDFEDPNVKDLRSLLRFGKASDR